MDNETVLRFLLRKTGESPPGELRKAPVAPMLLNPVNMMIAGLIIAGFAVAGVVIGMVVAKTAPVGYQDEKGFHFGTDQSAHAETYAYEAHAKAA